MKQDLDPCNSPFNIDLVHLEEGYIEDLRVWRNQTCIRKNFFNQACISTEEQSAWYGSYCKNASDMMFMLYGKKEDCIIGSLGLRDIDLTNMRCEFGRFFILPEYRDADNSGRAVGLALHYAFYTLSLHKVYCHALASNKPALMAYTKTGFQIVGIMTEHFKIEGAWVDIINMAIFERNFSL